MLKKGIFFFCLMLCFHLTWSQQIEIQGGGMVIPGKASNTPKIEDDTFFEETPVSGARIHTFKLTNTGSERVRVERIQSTSSLFKVDGSVGHLSGGETKTFELSFEPDNVGDFGALIWFGVRIGRARAYYGFFVRGTASVASSAPEIMITQYYENGDHDQVEIKNLTDHDIRQNEYYLVKFNRNDDVDSPPRTQNVINIDHLSPGETAVFDQLTLRGNEVVIISTSRGRNSYNRRVDIIGQQNLWGRGKSFSKGACASEVPHSSFNINDWIEVPIEKVDQALSIQNIALGMYQLGPISWTNAGWTGNALPDQTREVFIEYDYQGNIGNVEACDLTVNASLEFNHNSTNSVVVYRDLVIDGSFVLGDTESLVMYDDNAQIRGAIEKIEKSTYRYNKHDITYWSSPIDRAKISEAFQGVSSARIFQYGNGWAYASDFMDNGRGYAAEGKAGTIGIHEVNFVGKPNNGLIYRDLFFINDEGINSNLENDFNLLGNPYPSAIDIEAFLIQNAALIEPTIHLWTHATPIDSEGDYTNTDYATFNYMGGTSVALPGRGGVVPTKNIGSSQGFFVRAIKEGQVEFNNSMRMEDANDQFFKGIITKDKKVNKDRDRIWLNLTTNKGGFNQLLIGFDKKATDLFDSGFDALKLSGGNKIGFYSILEDDKMAIQGFGTFHDNKEVTLGFDTKLDKRQYKISIANLEGKLQEASIILKDNLLLLSHDLKESPYIFYHDEVGEYKDRFTLSFSYDFSTSAANDEAQENISVSNQEDLFTVTTSEEVTTANVYDIRGRRIKVLRPHERSFDFIESESKKGEILLLELELRNQKRVVRKVYKQ